jgi:hypothetical protein
MVGWTLLGVGVGLVPFVVIMVLGLVAHWKCQDCPLKRMDEAVDWSRRNARWN